MTNKAFIKIFFSSLLIITLGYLLFICSVDPQRTAPLTLSSKYQNFHDNFLLRKAKLMETNNSFETLILGSSTSEAFTVENVNQLFKTTSFHGSLGGGNTASRFVLFKKALKNFSRLKRVIYIADFYEFNQVPAVPTLAFNDDLSKEVEDKALIPSRFEYIKYLFSHQMIESAFLVMKRSKAGYVSPLRNDGTTEQSMILSTVQTQENFYSKINPENKKKLMEEILENYTTYSQSVLANFKMLDPKIVKMYFSLVQEAKKKNIEVIFFMSPYHYEFKNLLFKNEEIKKRYEEWNNFFASLKEKEGVNVYNPLSSFIATESDSGVWRDGIHFNSYAATFFLTEIADRK